MAVLHQYLWIAILGGVMGFFYAFGIGANDVANAFASTVASKSLTLKQAVFVAGIFEFLGALLLGASVTTTIRSKIFDPNLYADEPEIVLLGMFTSLLTGTIMLLGATAFALPVSTTHTIVGSIMGFSIAAKGFSSINWNVATKIIVSWFVSPLGSGILGFIFFGTIKYLVLKTDNAYQRTYYTFPVILTIFIGIDLFYILFKGLKNVGTFKLEVVLPCAFGAGLVCGLIWIFLVGPWAKKRVQAHLEEQQRQQNDIEATTARTPSDGVEEGGDVSDPPSKADEASSSDAAEKNNDAEEGVIIEANDHDSEGADVEAAAPVEKETTQEEEEQQPRRSLLKNVSRKFAERTYKQDLHSQSMHESDRARELWDTAEHFDADAEQLFTYVQVFTACLNSFAHGANDVSNAIAPLSAIILIYQTGEIESKSPVQKWVLAYGGVAIVLGLLLYGYKVMKSVGYKLCMLSPSRGANAELAASLFVVTASFLEIPVSSTQCIVGAVSGVGLVGGFRNVQWLFLLRVCVGWVLVFFTAVLLSAGVFAMFAYSPSLTD